MLSTYSFQYGDGPLVSLPLNKNFTIAALDADVVFRVISSTSVEYLLEFTANRTQNNKTITCILHIVGGTQTATVRLNIQYPPRMMPTGKVPVPCLNATDDGPKRTLNMTYTENVEDLGNPAGTVSWDPVLSGTVSGLYNQYLSLGVTREQNDQVISATVVNILGSAEKSFSLCVKSKSNSPSELNCSRVAVGYNCSWERPDDDGGYSVTWYRYLHSATRGNAMSFLTSETTAVKSSLEENSYYNISVYAVTVLGDGEPATTALLTPKRPDPPAAVSASATSSDSIRLSWQQPPNPDPMFGVLDYRVGLHTKKNFIWEEALLKKVAPDLECTFSGLNPNTLYWARVAARNLVGWGDSSTAVNPSGKAGSPDITRTKDISSDSFRVEWTAALADPAFPVTGFRVVVYEANMKIRNGTVSVTQHYIIIRGLQAGTEYDVEVYALNRVGDGEPSQSVTVETLGDKNPSSSNIGLIVGVVVGTLVVVAVVRFIRYNIANPKP